MGKGIGDWRLEIGDWILPQPQPVTLSEVEGLTSICVNLRYLW